MHHAVPYMRIPFSVCTVYVPFYLLNQQWAFGLLSAWATVKNAICRDLQMPVVVSCFMLRCSRAQGFTMEDAEPTEHPYLKR